MTGRWEFVLLGGGTSRAADWVPVTDLSSAVNRKVSLLVDGTSTISFGLNGLAEDATYIQELRTDVMAYRSGTAITRGRVVGTSDTVQPGGHSVSVTVADYRTLLTRRLLYAGDPELLAWSTTVGATAVEQRTIAFALIQRTQARLNGDLGITLGPEGPTGVTRNRTYEAGSNISDLVTNLSNVANGFDWEIDAALRFRCYYPQRGVSAGYLLDLGGAVQTVQRAVQSSQYSSRVRFSGGVPEAGGSAPISDASVTPGIEGNWEVQLTDAEIIDQAASDQRAAYELDQRDQILPSYTVTLNPELWDPADFWLGDTGRLSVQSGRLNIDTDVRCLGLDFDIDNDGYERVTATLGRLSPTQDWYQRQAAQARDLVNLGKH